MQINYFQASGKEVAELVDKIETVVDGESNVIVSIACIVVATLSQNPEVAPDTLQSIVKGVSEYIAASVFNTSKVVN